MPKQLVVVTGSGHGIGRALAHAFATKGHPLLLISRHSQVLDGLSSDRVLQAQVDVADYVSLQAAIDHAESLHGPTGCLINNAGFLRIGAFEERDEAEMSYEIDVLFKGVLHGIRAVLPGMVARENGTVINISSIADRTPGPQGEVYHACKAAVRSLAASLQKDLAARHVRIINVAPGFVRTNIHADMGISFEEYCRRLGNPDFISAEELADIVMFCWEQPPHVLIRDIVVMPTSSDFG
jgi:NADP-dependent 3-hydroxy acid dehydrogenase YdfG